MISPIHQGGGRPSVSGLRVGPIPWDDEALRNPVCDGALRASVECVKSSHR